MKINLYVIFGLMGPFVYTFVIILWCFIFGVDIEITSKQFFTGLFFGLIAAFMHGNITVPHLIFRKKK